MGVASWERQSLNLYTKGNRHMKIKDLPKVDRSREKLEKYGPERLSNSELLAILLRTGSEGINVIELASKIFKSLAGMA